MRLTRVKIENHHHLQDLELEVRQHMVLIGPNNAGKSSLLRCLDLLLGASTAQLYNKITYEDLREPDRPLIIEAELCEFSQDEKALFPDEISINPNNKQTLTIRLEASFDVNQTLSISRTVPNKNIGRQISRDQLRGIGWTLLNANDYARNLDNNRRSLLDDVLASVELGDEKDIFDELFKKVATQFQSSKALSKLRSAMADQLSTTLPEKIAKDNLVLLPNALAKKNVLSGVQLHIDGKPINEQSDGQRAIYAIALYDLISNEANIVAIDEPEIHLHPNSQRNLAQLLKNGTNQKIIATHSSDIVSTFDPELIMSVRPSGEIIQPKKGFLTDNQRMALRWWKHDKLEPLTARHVVFVEGLSDRIVLEKVAELTDRNLDRLGISVIETGGAGDMAPMWDLFGPNGFRIPISLLIDEDAETKTRKDIGGKEELNSCLFISRKDLEDEYTKAIGVESYWKALHSSNLFKCSELKELNKLFEKGELGQERLASFCREKARGRKIYAAIIAAKTLDESSARNIKSINDLLDSLEV